MARDPDTYSLAGVDDACDRNSAGVRTGISVKPLKCVTLFVRMTSHSFCSAHIICRLSSKSGDLQVKAL